jgi:hypothetical protein
MLKISSFFVVCCAFCSTQSLAHAASAYAEDPSSSGVPHATVVPNDAGVTDVRFQFDDYCGEEGYFIVNFDNYGSNTLEKVTIEWTINGVAQEPYHWVGSLPPQYSGGYFTAPGALKRFTRNTIKAWVALANDVADGNAANDAVEEIINGSFVGTFTIGGTSPDFATIREATEQMADFNACGNVTFLIRPGVYNEQVVVKNLTASYIEFQSETGDPASVLVSHTAVSAEDNFVWKLEGNHTTLEGVTIRALGSEYATGIFVPASDFGGRVIRNNIIVLSEATEGDAEENKVGIRGESAYVSGNRIEGGTTAVLFQSTPSYGSQATIIDNEFRDQSNGGIHLRGLRSALINNNTVHSGSGIAPEFCGMLLENGSYATIGKNKLYTYGQGISLINYPSSDISNNFISLKNSAIGSSPSFGIVIDGSSASLSILYNSVLVSEDLPGSAALKLQNISDDLEVNNNIFYNKGGGVAAEILDLRLSREFQLDYNNMLSSGPTLVHFFGYIPDNTNVKVNEAFPSLRDWNRWSGYDEHSISADPQFNSDSDLHAQSYLLTGGAQPAIIATDIDGKTRDFQYPTIGAHEFGTLRVNDLSLHLIYDDVICNADQGLNLEIRNDGFAPVTSFEITKTINGVIQSPETYPVYMHPRSMTNIYVPLGTFLLNIQQSFTLSIAPGGGELDLYQDYNSVGKSFVIHGPVEIQVTDRTCDPPSATLSLPDGYSASFWWGERLGELHTQDRSVTVSASDIYYVSAADANGCPSYDSSAIRIPNMAARMPELEYEKSALCPGETIMLRAVVTFDTTSIAYSWFKDGQLISGASDDTLAIDAAAQYSFTVSSGPCSASADPVVVTMLEPPTIPLVKQTGNLCPGKAVLFEVTSDIEGNTFLWYMDDVPLVGWGLSPSLGTDAPGSYRVEKSNGKCKSVSAVMILEKLNTPPKPIVSPPAAICAGESVQLVAPAGFVAYLWSTGETTKAITVNKSGSYTVSVSNVCESPLSDPVTVTVHPVPIASVSFIEGKLRASGGGTYQWFLDGDILQGKTQLLLDPEISGSYHVEVTAQGCTGVSQAITVVITGVESAGFTDIKLYPNPARDHFVVELSDRVVEAHVKIYNTYGREFTPLGSRLTSTGMVLDIGNLVSGVYYVLIVQGIKTASKKIVVY